jgi:hypothetical protein
MDRVAAHFGGSIYFFYFSFSFRMFQAAQIAAESAAETTGARIFHASSTEEGKPPFRIMQTSGIRTPRKD